MNIRQVYIAGKYRHYHPDGTYDDDAMAAEIDHEQQWAALVAECGMFWFAPLANSVFLEDLGTLEPHEYIERDLIQIGNMRPAFDILLLRPGWDEEPESVGARKESEAAREHGLLIAHGMHGKDAVQAYLLQLNAETVAP